MLILCLIFHWIETNFLLFSGIQNCDCQSLERNLIQMKDFGNDIYKNHIINIVDLFILKLYTNFN